MAKQRDPAHYLTAIALLAYLGADDDGPVTVADDPDEARRGQRETLLGIRDDADRAEPDLHESEARSALALVSAAIDLLDAAEVDARDVGSRDVDRRLRKAGRHLAEVAEVLGAAVRLEALETQVERLRAASPTVVATERAIEGLRRMVPTEGPSIGSTFLSPMPNTEPDAPDAPATLADLPVGTITVYAPLGMVRVRLPDGWDLAVGSDGEVYSVAPGPGLEPGSYEDVVRIGTGTVPNSWLESHAEVAEFARAWLAERGRSAPEAVPLVEPVPVGLALVRDELARMEAGQAVPVPDGTVPELESLDPSDDDGYPF